MVFRNQLGPPNFIYRRPGFWGTIGKYVPAPLKVFGCISLAAAATVILAPAVIILAAPPLLYGAWFLRRRNKYLSSVISDMHNRRWQDMASFHLQLSPVSENSQKIPTMARVVVERSLESNEHQLATQLGVSDVSSISFGALSALSQDFRMGPYGGSEKMSIAEYPLIVGRRTRATVRVVSRENAKSETSFLGRMTGRSSEPSKTRIEIELPNGRQFVLRTTNDNDSVIEGRGREVK